MGRQKIIQKRSKTQLDQRQLRLFINAKIVQGMKQNHWEFFFPLTKI